MSAIVAAAGRRELSPPTRRWLSEATLFSSFAGPDGHDVQIGRRYGLGHALLRVAPTDRAQPLAQGGVSLVGVARLDDRTALVASLRAHGQAVDRSADDAELLLAAYVAWGESFLERISGDFAFALWDERRGQMLCGRDQLGVVPLHYALIDDELLVASAIDALLLHPAVGDELDERAIADFLLTGSTGFEATTFHAIRRLQPAHALAWADGNVHFRRYWSLREFEPLVRFKSPDEYAAQFRELLETAVADRVTSDRVAVHLSGGMDSTSVAALAARFMRQRGEAADAIRAVTAVLGGDTEDQEGAYAALVAERLGITLDVVDESLLQPTDPLTAPEVVTAEPTWYPWTRLGYEVARLPSLHARVTLSGLGGDPLLMFVPWYWAEWLARGNPLRLAHAFVDNARLFGDRPHPHLRRSGGHAWAVLGVRKVQPSVWLSGDFVGRTGIATRMDPASPRANLWDARSLFTTPLWSTLFTWGDPSFHRLPTRLRHPFADVRLLQFAMRLPPYPWLVRKRILREAARDLLPREVLERSKTPLVEAPRPSSSVEVMPRLAELVCAVPEADRFFDTRKLIGTIMTLEEAHRRPYQHEFVRALGLVHWLLHWSRPDADLGFTS